MIPECLSFVVSLLVSSGWTDTLLIRLVRLVDRIPEPPVKPGPARGRPRTYSDRLFLKALVIMIVKHLHRVHELLQVLEQPTWEMQTLRQLLSENDRFPSRRTWERRLKAMPETLSAQIGCLGRHLVELLQPFSEGSWAAAIDSTILLANGGVWHKKHRDKGEVPHTSIDTQAHWTKSGWHGWCYGWKLHVIACVGALWIPLMARLEPAHLADSELALKLLPEIHPQIRFILGDQHYNTLDIQEWCESHGKILVATRRGRYPHPDGGAQVRSIFHQLRSMAIEKFNEHFKSIFDGHGQVPTKGKENTQRYALAAVLVYQLALLERYEAGQEPATLLQGLKAYLKAA